MNNFGVKIISIIFLLSGCDETSTSTVSVKDDFTKAGNGTMVATVEKAGDNLILNGNLNLAGGEFNIFLSNPSEDTIYSESFKKTGKYTIDKTFKREIGKWVFSYSIVKVDTIIPEGSFDIDLIYNN